MQTCAHCGAVNPDENGYCDRCHGLLEPLALRARAVAGTYHPYLMWDRWPWARFTVVTQSYDQFLRGLAFQVPLLVIVLALLAFGFSITFGPGAAAAVILGLGTFTIAYGYLGWRAGRRRAMWYAQDHP